MSACLSHAEKQQGDFNFLQRLCREDEDKKQECIYRLGRITLEEAEAKKELEELQVQLKSSRLEVLRIKENCRSAVNETNMKTENWNKIRERLGNATTDLERLQTVSFCFLFPVFFAETGTN